jgi:hypothetical protein
MERRTDAILLDTIQPVDEERNCISSFLVSALPRIIRILHEEADVSWKENKTPLGTFLSVPRLGTGQFERHLASKRGGCSKKLSAFSWTERSQIRCREAP